MQTNPPNKMLTAEKPLRCPTCKGTKVHLGRSCPTCHAKGVVAAYKTK